LLEEFVRVSITAEKDMLPVVDAFVRLAIGERGGSAT
jgi:hypothetical protein